MGYMNPIHKIGSTCLIENLVRCDIDGILIVDAPPEESYFLNKMINKIGKSHIYLISPTTSQKRQKEILKKTSGYIYYVSLKGITGSQISSEKDVKKRVTAIKKATNSNIPIAVGFGIKNAESAKAMVSFSDGIIIGSSIVQLMGDNHSNLKSMNKKIFNFVKSISRVM